MSFQERIALLLFFLREPGVGQGHGEVGRGRHPGSVPTSGRLEDEAQPRKRRDHVACLLEGEAAPEAVSLIEDEEAILGRGGQDRIEELLQMQLDLRR